MNEHTQRQVCNIDYDNELNKRLNGRMFPDVQLQPMFNPIPISTKYQKYPTNDNVNDIGKLNKSLGQPNYKYFNPEKHFYGGTRNGPVAFSFDNVDVESRLRNQFFALQKNDKAFYVPSTKSDLYTLRGGVSHAVPKGLEKFKEIKNLHFNPDRCNLAPENFNNSTRHNLKNLNQNLNCSRYI